MNRKFTRREIWLLTALPALVVLAVYVFAFYRPQRTVLAEADRRVHALQSDLTTVGQLTAKRSELARAQQQVRLAKRELSKAQARPSSREADGPGEAGLLARTSRILLDHSVAVAASSRLGDAEAVAAIPADLRDKARGGAPSLWRLDMAGGFVDVREALEALAQTDLPVVPLGISMEPSGVATAHHWKLLLWMPPKGIE
ncbi:MAG: hypothetical protein NTV86_00410 [Planctomycetota bacterium]|nr:hypothetical protein [Planctomycetota bacterium]